MEQKPRTTYSWQDKDPSARSNPLRDDAPINDPAEAQRVLQASLDAHGLPRGITILSIRERGLIPKETLREMLASAKKTNVDPDDVIRHWINTPENHYQIFTVREFADKIGVSTAQLKKFMNNYGWRFKKVEKRKYEVRPDERT